jgi:carotenoid cleavage dioxygenase
MPFQFFNLLAHVNLKTGTTDAWFPGDSGCFQEPIFIPRAPDAQEADGYVVALLNLIAEGRSELVVLDSRDMESGPIARIKIPFRMRMSLHGCWAPSKK